MNGINGEPLLLNSLFYSPDIALRSGYAVQSLENKEINLSGFLDLIEQDIGTAEMDDYLIEVIQNFEDLKNE